MANTLRKPLFLNPNGIPEETALTDLLQLSSITLTGDVNGIALNASNMRIAAVGTPTAASDAVNKGYVDGIASGLSIKAAVRALAIGNVALTGTQTIDGVALAAGDRVLLVGQTNLKQNGIWVVAAGAWARSSDFATGSHAAGSFTFVEEGTAYASEGWVNAAAQGQDVVDTNNLSYTQFSGAGELTFSANSGLSKLNNLVSLAFSNGIYFDGTGVSVKVDGATTSADGSGVHVIGVPANVPIAGTPTVNFSAVNVNTLLGAGYADNLHKHIQADYAGASANAIVGTMSPAPAVGAPLYAGASGMALADAASDAASAVIGVASPRAGFYTSSGVAKGALSAANPGAIYYLAVGGGLATTPPTASGSTVVRVGFAVSATDLVVMPQYLGKRA